ncbi:MAG: hypothetical protein ACRDVW_09510 [Acidimicrobiales bacterium]
MTTSRSAPDCATSRRRPAVAFLEGGYDLGALRASVGAFGSALAGGTWRLERSSIGEAGCADVDAIATWQARQPRTRC